jgi:hypothetical protein
MCAVESEAERCGDLRDAPVLAPGGERGVQLRDPSEVRPEFVRWR